MKYYELIADIAKNNKRLAITYSDVQFTYEELDKMIDTISYELMYNRIETNAKVGVSCQNKLTTLLILIALNKLSAVAVPIYPQTGKSKIHKLIKEYDLAYIICDEDVESLFEEVELKKNALESVAGCYLILSNYQQNKRVCYEDLAMILLSSGTTGRQKGIMLSNENIISNMMAVSLYLGITKDDAVLHVKNRYHSSSILSEVILSLTNGAHLVLLDDPIIPRRIYEKCISKKITILFAIPAIIESLMDYSEKNNLLFADLRVINFYGSPVQKSVISRMLEVFKGTDIIYSYGLSEASPRVTYARREVLELNPGTVGKEIDNVEVKILDSSGDECNVGIIGNIMIKSPGIMVGYYGNQCLTDAVMYNGFLNTGDLGYKDKMRNLYVIGRRDNMFICCGKNIYPEEIEEVLMESGVFRGVRVEVDADEKIVAYAEGDRGSYCAKDVLKFCRDNLEDYKIPHRIIVVDALERTKTGKIQRKGV